MDQSVSKTGLFEKAASWAPGFWLWAAAVGVFEFDYAARVHVGWSSHGVDLESRMFCWALMGAAVMLAKAANWAFRNNRRQGSKVYAGWFGAILACALIGSAAGFFWLSENSPKETRSALVAKLEYQKSEQVGLFDPRMAMQSEQSGPSGHSAEKVLSEVKADIGRGRELVGMEMALALAAWVFGAGFITLLLPMALGVREMKPGGDPEADPEADPGDSSAK